MNNKTDLRIVKTNKALFNALLELMKEKTFEEIKISDVCTKSLVNRSTFYAHYNDKYELLVALFDELKQNLLSTLKTNENNINSKEFFMETLKLLINHRTGILMDILLDVADKDIKERIENDKNIIVSNIPSEIITKFYLGAIISIGMEWLRNNNKYTKEQLIKYLDILIPDKI